MAGHGLDTDQVDEHASSVHGRLLYEEGDVGAPVCNDCHGNHGAAPPGIAAVRNVCGQCHSVMAEFFDASGHEPHFEDRQLPLCAACHDHHAVQPVDDATLAERAEEICTQCHVPGDEAGLSFQAMAAVLNSLTQSAALSREHLEEAERMGMEVSQALFELEEVNNAQTRARSAIHSFSVDVVRREVDVGLAITQRASGRADDAFAEYDFRRLGLGVSSGIILLLVVGLLLKIRDMEQREDRPRLDDGE
jgi:predicted CXXCH cytochrome family protein